MKAVLTNYMQPTTSQSFGTEQMDRYEGKVTGAVKLFIRAKPTTAEAELKYDYPSNIKEGVLFDVSFNSDDQQTAVDLCTAINNEVSNSGSPLCNLVSAGDLGLTNGEFAIEANVSHITLEITCISGCELSQTNEPFDMTTDDREFVLKADVRTGSIAYLETGDEVTYLNGIKKDAGENFDIEGKENILRAKAIEITSGSDLNYTIYIK